MTEPTKTVKAKPEDGPIKPPVGGTAEQSSGKPPVGTLAQALLEFQRRNVIIKRDREGQARAAKYRYATLDEALDVVRPILSEVGLVVSNRVVPNEEGTMAYLVITLGHATSGEHINSHWPIVFGDNPQQVGIQITYYRRYGLAALLNLATEEDDDAQGSGGQVAVTRVAPSSPPARQAPQPVRTAPNYQRAG